MNHYGIDIRGCSSDLTPGQLQAIACETLGLCEGVGCSGCGFGDDPEITCKQLESDQAGYELAVSASEGPSSSTGYPGWLLIGWWSRGALHLELNLDEAVPAERARAFFDRLHALGFVSVSMTNRAATAAEHPAAALPRFRVQGDEEFA